MTNKRENSSIFSKHPSRRPEPNVDNLEPTRPGNLLVKKNNVVMVKRDQEKFSNAGAVPDVNVHVGHASAHNEGGLMRAEENGRERLKRHRIEVAGHVWIPEIWGQEELLKDWIDCSAFDAKLINNNIMSAKAALVEERRKTNSSCRLRIEY